MPRKATRCLALRPRAHCRRRDLAAPRQLYSFRTWFSHRLAGEGLENLDGVDQPSAAMSSDLQWLLLRVRRPCRTHIQYS